MLSKSQTGLEYVQPVSQLVPGVKEGKGYDTMC